MDAAVLAGGALGAAATAYATLAALATLRARRAGPHASTAASQPVTILKPLCGAEPRLYDNLATFCRQAHPCFQLVFGVREAGDAAVAVVRRLQADYPQCDIALVIDQRTHGSNPKVSNLLNMMPHARHDWLVLADSDIAVPDDYLARVTAPLAAPGTGVVTCLYEGRPQGNGWPQIGAQFIDDWFAPSVRVAHAGGSRSFAFGATIALRRDALDAIGGLAALKDRLADDYWLGELTRRKRLATVLSDVVVTTDVTEQTLRDLWRHELRWMRTIRSLNPAGFAFTFITFTWPMLFLGLAISRAPLGWALLLAGGVARCLLSRSLGAAMRSPLRDALLLAEWAAALGGTRVRWRQQTLSVHDAQSLSERSP
jgi:ceramide glucosyltransferase